MIDEIFDPEDDFCTKGNIVWKVKIARFIAILIDGGLL